MSGRSTSPEPGQVVWRPEGGAEASLAGTTPLEVKASDQAVIDPCLEEEEEQQEDEQEDWKEEGEGEEKNEKVM